eukprot:CAMPEP_0177392004 /NCGR_PEP_ID=MMETSP0368-20130122/54117_1 /TAXON_ID=447022 ORGANISM="Scrippsiella hangoei-like, Strain SHHI-4" /NCGR_SAMPLE_ID=MMETSP0368 /ASSEMBLY_ACC=CAM_ASM_000363 /LENGTH=41 /DNA_ID= /DNA_START= /DNA_END= /DNA_ORIENTATION=
MAATDDWCPCRLRMVKVVVLLGSGFSEHEVLLNSTTPRSLA